MSRLDTDPTLERLRDANPVDAGSLTPALRDHPAGNPRHAAAHGKTHASATEPVARRRTGAARPVPRLVATLLVTAVVAVGAVIVLGASRDLGPPAITDATGAFRWTQAGPSGTHVTATFTRSGARFHLATFQPLVAGSSGAPQLGQEILEYDEMVVVGGQRWVNARLQGPAQPAHTRWYRIASHLVQPPVRVSDASVPTFTGAAGFRRTDGPAPTQQVRYRADAGAVDLGFLGPFAPDTAGMPDVAVDLWVDGDDRVRRFRLTWPSSAAPLHDVRFDPVATADLRAPVPTGTAVPTIVDRSGLKLTPCNDATPDDLAAAVAALRSDPTVTAVAAPATGGGTRAIWVNVRSDADLDAVYDRHRDLPAACGFGLYPGVAVDG